MQDNDRSHARLSPSGLAAAGPESALPTMARLDSPRIIDSRHLLGDGREVVITHDGAEYRLRLTASGKLILTK